MISFNYRIFINSMLYNLAKLSNIIDFTNCNEVTDAEQMFSLASWRRSELHMLGILVY